MANPRIKWNIPAFKQVRRTSEVKNMLQDVVDDVMTQLPEGYEGSVTEGKTRLRGSVVTAEPDAMADNAAHQSLLRALSNVRAD